MYPQCIGGERACPPEDCGGIPGFYLLLDAINDPHHEQHQERREWLSHWIDDYNPETFSIDDANRRLHDRFTAPR